MMLLPKDWWMVVGGCSEMERWKMEGKLRYSAGVGS